MQQRFRNYENPLGSFQHNLMNLAFHKPGRFIGFSGIEKTGAYTFNVTHVNGIEWKDENGTNMGPAGAYMTPQGTIIMEDAKITGLAVDANFGNNSERIDLLVANHVQNNTPGGNPATYSIIKGPINNPTAPSLTNPSYQTILAYIVSPRLGGVGQIGADIRIVPNRAPDSGDGIDARINESNVFQRLQQFRQNPNVNTLNAIGTGDPADYFTFSESGNLQKIVRTGGLDTGYKEIKAFRFDNIGAPQDGTSVKFYIESNTHLFHNHGLSAQEQAAGFRSINIPKSFRTASANPMLTLTVTQPTFIEFLKMDNQWWVVDVKRLGIQTEEEEPEETGGFRIHYAGSIYLGDRPGPPNHTGSDELIAISYNAISGFPTLPEHITDPSQTFIFFTLVSTGSNWNQDNDVFGMIRAKSLSGFQLLLREVANVAQNLRLDFQVVIPN